MTLPQESNKFQPADVNLTRYHINREREREKGTGFLHLKKEIIAEIKATFCLLFQKKVYAMDGLGLIHTKSYLWSTHKGERRMVYQFKIYVYDL